MDLRITAPACPPDSSSISSVAAAPEFRASSSVATSSKRGEILMLLETKADVPTEMLLQ